MQGYSMWIGGEWVKAESGKTYASINPATEEEIAEIPLADTVDVDKAVAAAKEAFPMWSGKTQNERSKMGIRIAQAIRDHADELAYIEMLDHGSPLSAILNMQIPAAAEHFEYPAQAARALTGDTIPLKPKTLAYVRHEPVGVCAIITPWNFPLLVIAEKLGMALAMGNTCVVKPPSIGSLGALKLAEILDKMDLPPGTVNVVTGPGGVIGDALTKHPGVDKVAFTGSCEVGKDLMSCASSRVKRIQLELGGKNPFIVLEDADIDAAVDGGVYGSFFNSGMICAAPGRYYVHEKIHDLFVEKFISAAKALVVGDPSDPKTQMGPVVSAEHREKVESYIRLGVQEGAKLLLGGQRPGKAPLDKGYYVMPAVFTNVTQDMRINRDEIFGPVVGILKFGDQDDVLALANDNTFGLCASVWTKDLAKGIEYAEAINAGHVWINEHLSKGPELPWTGFRESGIGTENSIYGLYEYSRVKLIYAEMSQQSKKPWHVL